MKQLGLLLLLACTVCSCKNETETKETAVANPVVFDGIDYSIKPGNDFFNHVNKTWYDQAVIAEDQVGVGSYRFLNIPQKKLLKDILEEVAQGDFPQGSIEQKVGDFYASGMDTVSINKRGIEPIQPILNDIDAVTDIAGMMQFVAQQIKSGDYSIIAPYIAPDQQNSTVNIAHFGQTGIGLPDRDYYFKEDESVAKIQEAYKSYIETLFSLIGDTNAKANAETVYNIEKQLAESHKTRIERRDVKANYNKTAMADLNANQQNLHWNQFQNSTGISVDSVNIRQPAYFKKLNSMLETVPLKDWKTYLKAHTLSSYDNVLSKPFEDASFEYSKVISGQSVQKARSEIMVQRVDGQLGFALGQLYVKRHFNEDAKKRALDLVNNFQKTLEVRINALDWMSDSTKVKAIDKLHAISKKIGYPDKWREYDVTMYKDKFFENAVALAQDNFKYNLKKLNQPPNRDEWYTTPSTVTAYYNPSMNEIVFPAGILQPPYFDLYADDAVNYGGIGMVIGHEFTHAFDDQGAQYDKEGNVKNWWTESDYEKFRAKTQQIIEQYDAFTVLDTVHLKGALTVGENTADNGGIAIAFDAFKLTEQAKDTTRINGFTPNERFFMSIARIWRVKTRDAYLRNYVANDPHSPPIWRVNGPLMNFTPFYETFDVQPEDANYRPESERIKIW